MMYVYIYVLILVACMLAVFVFHFIVRAGRARATTTQQIKCIAEKSFLHKQALRATGETYEGQVL